MAVVDLHADRDANLVSRCRDLFQRARDHRRARHDTWIRNYRLIHNKIGTSGLSSWMPSPRDSEIFPTLSSVVAWMMDNNVNIDAIPSADPNSPIYSFTSDLANDLADLLYTNWIVENYNIAVKLAIWDSLTYGVGIFKNIWDGDRDDGYGNSMMYRVDPWKFYVDPTATSLDDMEYCVEARRMSLDEIERRYPDAPTVRGDGGTDLSIDEKPDLFTGAQGGQPMANAGSIPGSGSFAVSSTNTPGGPGAAVYGRFGRPRSGHRERYGEKGVVVYEFWLRENEKWREDIPGEDPIDHVTSRWRCVVMAQGDILMDEWADDLWSHGQHPYERFVFDDVGEFYGVALVDHLAYPQIYINRLLTMMEQNVELIGNPIFMEPANSGTARVPIINRPGQRLTLQGAAAMQNRPEWLVPPEMPQMVMELVNFWIQRIENTSGLSAITKGATPNQRNAEGVINTVQEAAFVRIRAALGNLEIALENCNVKLADLIIDNYTEKRVKAIIGPDGEKSAMVLFSRHFYAPSEDGDAPLKFIIQVTAGASAPTSRQARIGEADKLFALGAIDDLALLNAHQFSHPQEVLERLYDKRQKGLMGSPAASRSQRQG